MTYKKFCALCITIVSVVTRLTTINGFNLRLTVHNNGNYDLYINKQKWFSSGDVSFFSSNQLHTTVNGSLKLISAKEITTPNGASNSVGNSDTTSVGHSVGKSYDKLGNYVEYQLTYENENKEQMVNKLKLYDNFVIFNQFFPQELVGTSIGHADGLCTTFPSFVIDDSDGGDGYAHWVSWFYGRDVNAHSYGNDDENSYGNRHSGRSSSRRLLVAPGFQTPIFGEWNSRTMVSGGIGGTGVTAIYSNKDINSNNNSEQEDITVILSPMDNPMASSSLSPMPGLMNFGLMGNITKIPKDYETSFVMFVSSDGVHGGMDQWGELMRKYYNKHNSTVSREKDITLQYLGYTTDNGAYYYYNTEPNKNYEDTLIDLKAYADNNEIPYKYILLDSWWYYKSENLGVTDWSAMPDIFPNGLEYFYNKTNWLVQAHNRYWSNENIYSTTNDGDYYFINDREKGGAAPVEKQFWDYLLAEPSSKWGLVVYEQDWLFNEFYEYVGQMLESVHLGREWLLTMGAGAKTNNVNIQYCMPYIRHLLQSLEVEQVTQARASDDYVIPPYVGVDNWRIGGQSMLIDALGLAPSKDGFWSSAVQPNNPYGEDRYEPYSRLQSAVTTLSAGPVAIADGIGYSDRDLIMMSCMADGRLLQPSLPATLIDAAFVERSMHKGSGPDGEVWFAPSRISQHTFGSLFVADLQKDWNIRPVNLQYDLRRNEPKQMYFVHESNFTEPPAVWSNNKPLMLSACPSYSDFSVWTVSPVLSNGWSIAGERNKWVKMSPHRFIDIAIELDGIEVSIVGVVQESITVDFITPEAKVISVSCVFQTDKMKVSSSQGCL